MSDTIAEPVIEMGSGGIAGERLLNIVQRIERLEEEKKSLAGDVRDLYLEAKSAGFDVKALRQLIRTRKMEAAELEELESLIDVYRHSLGLAANDGDARD